MQEDDWASEFTLEVNPQQNVKTFAHDGRLDFVSDGQGFIEGYELEDRDGESFTPRQMLLHDAGYTALFLTPKKRHAIVSYDVETGDKLGDFTVKTSEHANPMNMESLTPSKKWDCLSQQAVYDLVAVGGRSITRLQWDKREKLKGNVLLPRSEEGTKTYSRVNFTAAVTKTNGGLAVGDKSGVVRLYADPTEKKMMAAKTNYEQYAGEPVIGMDVTGDGKWLMWTTKSTIQLVDVTLEGGKDAFSTRAGDNKKEVLRLKLSTEELKSMGISAEQVDFTAARFDNNAINGLEQKVIATSTGPFIVSWNLRHVLADYRNEKWNPADNARQRRARIIHRQGRVLTEAFEYGNEADTLVGALSDRLERFSLGGRGDGELMGSMVQGSAPGTPANVTRCKAVTNKGNQCSRSALSGFDFCYQHYK